MLRDAGEKHRSLTSRVAYYYYDHLPFAAEQRLHCSGRVIDTVVFKSAVAFHQQLAILRAGSNNFLIEVEV